MILEFLISNWRSVLLAALIASTALFFNLWRGAEHGKMQLEVEFKLKVAQAEAAAKVVQDRSDKTLEKINADHKQAVVDAEKYAVANYLRRYGTGGLSVRPCTLAAPGAASGPQVPNATPAEPVSAPNTDFINACATDALQVTEWQKWSRLNRMPVEGE